MFRFIYLFIFFQSFSQNQYLENGNRNGTWKGYYDCGQIRYEGTFDDGKEIGLFKYYYRSGNLEKEFFYTQNGVQAQVRIYYSDRKIKTIGEYCSKKRCGTWEYFDNLGNIILKENYVDDVLNGSYFVYFEGSLAHTYIYINGKKNGLAKSFFASGQIKILKNYLNDKLHGSYEVFNKKGELIDKLNYSNGFLD